MKMLVPTDGVRLMKCDFVSQIERAQMDPNSCLDTYVNEKTVPFRVVTGVVATTTFPMPKSEQENVL